jgi:multicomponent Na+:H+ antiporter subunit F
MELIYRFEWIFYVLLILLALMMILCLIRAVMGPRLTDRLISVNMIGTMVTTMIGILAVIKKEGYLVDVCLIYAMISFLAVVVLTKVYTGVYLEEKDHLLEVEQFNKKKDTETILKDSENGGVQNGIS